MFSGIFYWHFVTKKLIERQKSKVANVFPELDATDKCSHTVRSSPRRPLESPKKTFASRENKVTHRKKEERRLNKCDMQKEKQNQCA
jgi:hypothetical protein